MEIELGKIVKGLEVCRDMDNPPGYRFTSCKQDCPYFQNGCARKLKEDAFALLEEHAIKDENGKWHPFIKEQPVEIELEGGGSTWWYVCGECHGAIDKGDAYCRHCGRRQRWDK